MTGQDRAQTPLDFAIAMGIFLLAVTFVFTFIPSLTAPFVDGNQEGTAVADRVASHLVEGSLADPDDPYLLNVTCTTGFFEEDDSATIEDCGYETTPADFRNRIGVSDRPNVNITLVRVDASTREETVLCDDGNGNVVEANNSDCDTGSGAVVYRIGGDPSSAVSVTVARRVVGIDGMDATLFVRVW